MPTSHEWTDHSQLTSVKSLAGEFAYQYDEASHTLLTRMTGPALTAQYTYEPRRNLITGVTNELSRKKAKMAQKIAPGEEISPSATKPNRLNSSPPKSLNASPLPSYVYTNDLLGRRDEITHGGLAFQQLKFGDTKVDVAYNDRSEVTGATYKTGAETKQSYQYGYDLIGNRETYEAKGQWDESKLTYTSNALNQYQSITGAPAKDQRSSASISGSASGAFSHDADGNLLSDSQNNYT